MVDTERQSLYNVMITDNGYTQLISSYTTDSNTLIDHIYTNITNMQIDSGKILQWSWSNMGFKQEKMKFHEELNKKKW